MDVVRVLIAVVIGAAAGWAGAVCDRIVPDRLPWPGTRVPVDLRSSMIVAVTVLCTGACIWRFDEASLAELLVYVVWFALLVSLSAIDLDRMRLPDAMVLPGFVVALAAVSVVSVVDGAPERVRYALVGAAVSFGVLFAAHLVSPRGMGFGDVKFAAVLGLMIGWQADTVARTLSLTLWSLLIGFGAGSVVGLALLVARRRNQPFPFGPFLALGAGVTVLVSRAILG